LRWKLGGDLVFTYEMLGFDNARNEPRIYCHIHNLRKNLFIDDYRIYQEEARNLNELYEQGQEAEDNMIAKRAKRVENNKDPTTVTNDQIHGVLGVALVQSSLNDIIPAPLHNFTGLVTLLLCELEIKCPIVKERLKKTL